MTRQRNFARIGATLVCSIVLLGILSQNLAQIDLPTWTPNGFPVMFRSSESGSKWDDRGADDNICTVEDIVYGEWMDDKPLGSMEEVTERYQLAVSERLFSFAGNNHPASSSFARADQRDTSNDIQHGSLGLISLCSCPTL
jgi:hypothetical protein